MPTSKASIQRRIFCVCVCVCVIVCWSRRCLDPSFSRHLRFGIALLPEGPAPLRINGDGKGPWCSVFLCVELCWFLPTLLPCVRTFRAETWDPYISILCHTMSLWVDCLQQLVIPSSSGWSPAAKLGAGFMTAAAPLSGDALKLLFQRAEEWKANFGWRNFTCFAHVLAGAPGNSRAWSRRWTFGWFLS